MSPCVCTKSQYSCCAEATHNPDTSEAGGSSLCPGPWLLHAPPGSSRCFPVPPSPQGLGRDTRRWCVPLTAKGHETAGQGCFGLPSDGPYISIHCTGHQPLANAALTGDPVTGNGSEYSNLSPRFKKNIQA